LYLGLLRDFKWLFVIVDVDLPNIGVDQLHTLILHYRNNLLHEGVT